MTRADALRDLLAAVEAGGAGFVKVSLPKKLDGRFDYIACVASDKHRDQLIDYLKALIAQEVEDE